MCSRVNLQTALSQRGFTGPPLPLASQIFPLPGKVTTETGDPHRSQKGLIWARPLGGIEYLFITPTPPPNRQSRAPLSPRACPSFCAFCAPSFREVFCGSNLTPPAESGSRDAKTAKKDSRKACYLPAVFHTDRRQGLRPLRALLTGGGPCSGCPRARRRCAAACCGGSRRT